jgi:hypothetical protein
MTWPPPAPTCARNTRSNFASCSTSTLPSFADHYTHESIAAHQVDNKGGCSVEGAGIFDAIDMANTMANRAHRVAAYRVPPTLSSE